MDNLAGRRRTDTPRRNRPGRRYWCRNRLNRDSSIHLDPVRNPIAIAIEIQRGDGLRISLEAAKPPLLAVEKVIKIGNRPKRIGAELALLISAQPILIVIASWDRETRQRSVGDLVPQREG